MLGMGRRGRHLHLAGSRRTGHYRQPARGSRYRPHRGCQARVSALSCNPVSSSLQSIQRLFPACRGVSHGVEAEMAWGQAGMVRAVDKGQCVKVYPLRTALLALRTPSRWAPCLVRCFCSPWFAMPCPGRQLLRVRNCLQRPISLTLRLTLDLPGLPRRARAVGRVRSVRSGRFGGG